MLVSHLLDPADIGIEHLRYSIVVVVVDIQPCFDGQTSVPDMISIDSIWGANFWVTSSSGNSMSLQECFHQELRPLQIQQKCENTK